MTHFIKISEKEFKDWAIGEFKSPEFLYPVHGQELVIRQKNFSKSFELHLYSSLVNGETRDIGEDAIRLVLYDAESLLPVAGTHRINRVEGSSTVWERLKVRLDELYKIGQSQQICPRCSAHMVERENRSNGNKFMGCSAFPKCPRGQELRRSYSLRSGGAAEYKDVVQSGTAKGANALAPPPLKMTVLVEEKDCIPTSDFQDLSYPFEEFNRVQSTLLQKKLHKKDCNLILGTATSSGKTVCAEFFMSETLKKDDVVLYVSPLKSLSQEKYEDWSKIFRGYRICILTGDYRLSPEKAQELDSADIVVLTSEMIDSRTRNRDIERSSWLSRVGLVIVDEIHIISTSRGHCVEVGLMRFSKMFPNVRILGLSATLPNVEDFKLWLGKLNSKDTEVINSDWRPIKLTWEFIEYDTLLDYRGQQVDKISKALDIIKSKKGEKILCFVHDKTMGRMLLNSLRKLEIGAEFHSADLSLDKRLDIEERFENDMDVLIATSTLAWGKNTSARNVIILGVTRGLNAVDELDILQEGGRAGRVGFTDEGFCYLICDDKIKWQYRVNNPRHIESTLLNERILGFHILAEVKIGSIFDFNTLQIWFNRSLASAQEQWDVELIQKVLDKLVDWQMLHIDNQGTYKLRSLGKVSASLYYVPQDVHHWYKEFGKISDLGLWDSDLALSWALGAQPSQDYGYVPRDSQDRVFAYSRSLRALGLDIYDSVKACDLFDVLTGNEMRFTVRGLRYDGERIVEALKWIDQINGWGQEVLWKILPIRLKYGIGKELVALCNLSGVGVVKSKQLYKLGILSIDDFVEDNRRKINRVLGSELVGKLIKGRRIEKRRLGL